MLGALLERAAASRTHVVFSNTHLATRDDFPIQVKDILAKRVAFECSRPGCGQVTSGPQVDPARAVNVGVAAHITAASPDGPRFDPSLSSEKRRSHENGIWLCQTCAKLVDNDPVRYPAEELLTWKRFAEERAARALEGESSREGAVRVFGRLERLIPALLGEMRQDLAGSPLVRECVLLKREWVYNGSPENPVFAYFFNDHDNLQSQFQILENHGLVMNITQGRVVRYRLSEDLVQYLGVGS